MNKFERRYFREEDLSVESFLKKFPDMTREQAEQASKILRDEEVWLNDLYQVNVRRDEHIVHLSIKRRDKNPIHDWRNLQDIKNMLVGEEHEAVELYPAESRRVDSANQYHLWVSTDPRFRFPFGFTERLVTDEWGKASNVGQRKL